MACLRRREATYGDVLRGFMSPVRMRWETLLMKEMLKYKLIRDDKCELNTKVFRGLMICMT